MPVTSPPAKSHTQGASPVRVLAGHASFLAKTINRFRVRMTKYRPHGVFTFALEMILKGNVRGIDFQECVKRASGLMAELGFSQSPGCAGPAVKLKKAITWV